MAEPNAPLCGCDCGLFMSDETASSSILDVGWTNCECRFCGTNQACTVACSEVLRYSIALSRGKHHEFTQACRSFRGREDFTEDFKASHPKFCGDCIDHGLLQLRVEAVRRAKKRREEFANDNKPAKQRGFPGAPSS